MTWDKKAKAVRELLDKKCEVLDEYMKDEKDNLQNLFNEKTKLVEKKASNKTLIERDLEKLKAVNETLPLPLNYKPLTEYDISDLAKELEFFKVSTFVNRKEFAEKRLGGITLTNAEFDLLTEAMQIDWHRQVQGELTRKVEQTEKEIEAKIEFIAQSKWVSELQGCKEEDK